MDFWARWFHLLKLHQKEWCILYSYHQNKQRLWDDHPPLDLKILNLQIATSIWGNTCFEMILFIHFLGENPPPSRSKRSFGHHVDRQSRRICEFDPNCKSHTFRTRFCWGVMHDMWLIILLPIGSRYLYKFMSYYLKVMMIYEVMLYTIQYYQYLCNEYIFINKYNEVSQKHIWWAWYLQDAWNLEPWHHPSSTTSRVRVPSLINDTSSMALVLFPGMFTGMDAS